jgi:hypothetical protein
MAAGITGAASEGSRTQRGPLQLPPFPSLSALFGTARSGQGRAGFARRSEPLTARTVLEDGGEGKGGWVAGYPPRDLGQSPNAARERIRLPTKPPKTDVYDRFLLTAQLRRLPSTGYWGGSASATLARQPSAEQSVGSPARPIMGLERIRVCAVHCRRHAVVAIDGGSPSQLRL